MATHFKDYDAIAKAIINRIGKRIFFGIPIGLGKPIGLINAFYRLALADPTIDLTILTGLTLARPHLKSELEKRFAAPIVARLMQNYEDPLYEAAREKQQLPANIKIIEFFLTPGKYLHNHYVQQNYICSKYTSVVDDTLAHPINVLAQQMAHSPTNSEQFSLSCNTDVYREVSVYLNKQLAQGEKVAIVAEVNNNLPFMLGDAIVEENTLTEVVDTGEYRTLFPLPHDEILMRDHLIGLYTSTLIKDDSCLQVGIGKLGNALANALIMRQNNNADYKAILEQLNATTKFGNFMTKTGELAPFEKGLYASTEMFSDEYLEIYKANILKKRVYDHIGLQKLLNEGKITENFAPDILDILIDNQLIGLRLTPTDVDFLKSFGIFNSDVIYKENELHVGAQHFSTDLSLNQAAVRQYCLGKQLKQGKLMHSGFFIGSTQLYSFLKTMDEEVREQIAMTTISRTNTLLWSPELAKLQRKDARFVNTTMMINLDGSYVSDALKGMQEVSGVGGQFDFMDMALNLSGAHSIINCHSVREANGKVSSNIVIDYPAVTIPRYLRDVIVTEYGIADCRSKTDVEVIKTILNITDSRFQPTLLKKAKRLGKVPNDYEIPALFRNNYPAVIQPIFKAWQAKSYFQTYPFGSDLTSEEQVLAKALLRLQKSSKWELVILLLRGLTIKPSAKLQPYLKRIQLEQPNTVKEYIYKLLVMSSLIKNSLKIN